MASHNFGGYLAFMYGFVGKHGVADDIANRKNVGDIGALLFIDTSHPDTGASHPQPEFVPFPRGDSVGPLRTGFN